MEQLNIQERKLNVIEQLIILNVEEVFKEVIALINSSFKYQPINMLTKHELENRAKISNKNIEQGNVYSQDEVEKISENW